MSFSYREWWGLIHGMGLGALFLLAFAGGLAGLYSLRPALITPEGVVERLRRLKVGVVAMAVVAWLTVISGTWVVYPWYRAKGPSSARSQLLANPSTKDWHEFGMEWKEHIAWISPPVCARVRVRRRGGGVRRLHHQGRPGQVGGGCHGRRGRAAPGRAAA